MIIGLDPEIGVCGLRKIRDILINKSMFIPYEYKRVSMYEDMRG